MSCYPIWFLTSIALGALEIYALAAYGGNAERPGKTPAGLS
jgi:hypothetical protein